jgi:hypothetical protein
MALLALWAVAIAIIGIVSPRSRDYLGCIAFALLVPWGMFRATIKCPICGKNVARDVEEPVTKAWLSGLPDHCRYCNVSYNGPMPEKR